MVVLAHPDGTTTSPAQRGIWLTERLADVGGVHHMPFAVEFFGALDADALVAACDRVVAAHPVLASAVVDRDGVPVLRAVPAPRLDVVAVAEGEIEAAVRRFVAEPFDTSAGPLVRMRLHRLADDRHRLLVVAHHLAFDGTSTDLFVRGLAEAYRRVRSGDDAARPGSRDPDADAAEAAVMASLPVARELWSGLDPRPVHLPGRRRPGLAAEPGGAVEYRLDSARLDAITATASRLGVSVYELIVASVHALLARYGNPSPVTALDLGTRTAATADRIGVYVNEIPLATTPDPDEPFAAFAAGVRAALRRAYAVRHVPFGRAVGGLRPGTAFAPVSLTYRRRIAPPDFDGLDVEVDWVVYSGVARNDLRLHLVHGPDGCDVMWQYPLGAIDHAAVERMAGHWHEMLDGIAADPGRPIGDLPLLTAAEATRLRSGLRPEPTGTQVGNQAGNQAGARLGDQVGGQVGAATVVAMFDAVATATPGAVAVEFGDERRTYADVSAVGHRIAAGLAARGVGPGALVAVRLRRGPDLPAALLGVARTGAAYLPIDSEHPRDRVAFMLADAAPAAVLTEVALADPATDGPTVLLLDNPTPTPPGAPPPPTAPPGAAPPPTAPRIALRGRDLAYVLYTSGSTGRPKGVEVPHSALANLLASMTATLGARAGHAWLGITSLSFDISALEVFLPLVTGGRLVVAPDGATRDAGALAGLVARHGVTHVQATPSSWRMLAEHGFDWPSVVGLVGGEALPVPLAATLRSRLGRLINVYGPTETTIWSTAWDVPAAPDAVTIGTPVANTRVHVCDDRLGLVPAGVRGELCVGGAGVTRGYRSRPAATAERFVPDPWGAPGDRLYRTGDVVHLDDDGRLVFHGRTDNQVKLRGHRIELGEIEAALLRHPEIAAAAARVHDGGGDPRLVAYVVARSPVDAAGLRAHLSATLPAAMLPDVYVPLDAMPLTPNGKLDRTALPEPSLTREAPAENAATKGDPVVDELTAIWCEVLRVESVGPDEDLFDLGGHSLTITQISARIRGRLGVDLPLHLFYDDPTIGAIAEAVRLAS